MITSSCSYCGAPLPAGDRVVCRYCQTEHVAEPKVIPTWVAPVVEEAARVFSSPLPALTLATDVLEEFEEEEENLGRVFGTLLMATAGFGALFILPFSALMLLAWISAG